MSKSIDAREWVVATILFSCLAGSGGAENLWKTAATILLAGLPVFLISEFNRLSVLEPVELLSGLQHEFPGNALFPREIAHLESSR
ncbi:MAG: hypothetical protein WA485_27395 [Candidatus Sulfotelmatobacter sp.]